MYSVIIPLIITGLLFLWREKNYPNTGSGPNEQFVRILSLISVLGFSLAAWLTWFLIAFNVQ